MNGWTRSGMKLVKKLFAVGEYWSPYDFDILQEYLAATEGRMSLFDSVLQHNFYLASNEGNQYNFPSVFDNTLVANNPSLAVTLVDNHDTQPLQALEAPVANWFKPLAYAHVLLRQSGYPCVFYPDLYSAQYTDQGTDGGDYKITLPIVKDLEALLLLRKDYAYGMQRDYFDHGNCIGFTREGIGEKENSGIAVVLSNGDGGTKIMEIGKPHAKQIFIDALKRFDHEIVVNDDGWAEFPCPAGSVSAWIRK